MADPAPNPVESPPLAPLQIHSKVGAGQFAGALAVLTMWLLNIYGYDVPAEAAAAVTTVYVGVLGYVARS